MRRLGGLLLVLLIIGPAHAQSIIKCGKAYSAAKVEATRTRLKACITACTGVTARPKKLKWCRATHLRYKPGQQFATATRSRPALHFIPAGTFTMGSPKFEAGRDDDETQHSVTLTKPFLMMRTEVTQAQWAAVMGTAPSHFKGCANCPVERVSWYDAVAYLNTLSRLEKRSACYVLTDCTGMAGRGCPADEQYCASDYRCTVKQARRCTGYRLPTEAEWEYAARARSKGARHGAIDAVAWNRENSGSKTHPVGQKRANTWGLVDMLGNVWEWCWDWKGAYPKGRARDPQGPATGDSRVVRGGGWWSSTFGARSAYRNRSLPTRRYHYRGVRGVLSQIKE